MRLCGPMQLARVSFSKRPRHPNVMDLKGRSAVQEPREEGAVGGREVWVRSWRLIGRGNIIRAVLMMILVGASGASRV